MHNTADFERLIRARYNLTSDYGLAKILGLARQSISHHRSGRAVTWSDETGKRIAELLDLPPGYVLACLSAERAKDAEVKAIWQRVARSLQATASMILAALFLSSAAPDASAGVRIPEGIQPPVALVALYICAQLARGLVRSFAAIFRHLRELTGCRSGRICGAVA